jgi:hypothetical protein
MRIPPPGAGKQSNGDEEAQKPENHFAAFEHQHDQNKPSHPGPNCSPVMTIEVVKKLFNAIEIHIF